jgi:hypothetical protein
MTNEQQILIDRMVDGELTTDQQRSLLAYCEEHAGWRELALAYVESQVLMKELKALSSEATRPQDSVLRNRKEAMVESSSWNALSLAAAIVLSLSLGYGLSWWWQDESTHSNVGTDSLAQSLDFDPSWEDSTDRSSSMQFTLSNPATSELQQIDLPIVNASDLGPDWQQHLRPTLPQELLQEMRAGGLNVRQTRTVTRVRLPDGRRVFVPINYYFEQLYQ